MKEIIFIVGFIVILLLAAKAIRYEIGGKEINFNNCCTLIVLMTEAFCTELVWNLAVFNL